MSLHILVVEDNAALASNLAEGLARHGHVADFAYDGAQGLALGLAHDYDLVLLDLTLPVMDGLAVCRALRERSSRHLPVLMLTARDALQDKLEGFDCGADDYLVKPFELDELLARCHALARRHLLRQPTTLEIGTLRLDRRARAASRAGRDLKLGPSAFLILLALAEAHPRVVTRSELTRRLWQDEPPDSDALRSHLYQLRQAIDKPFGRPMLLTVHGAGFRLDPDA